jgi:hypothetical protein
MNVMKPFQSILKTAPFLTVTKGNWAMSVPAFMAALAEAMASSFR